MTPKVVASLPSHFSPKLIASALHLECKDRLLFLQKAKGQWSEHLWGVPCGTWQKGETIFQTAQRECREETGWQASFFHYLAPLYVLYPEYGYVFHMFYLPLEEEIPIKLSEEHVAARWLDLEELDSLPLIPGQKKALAFFLQYKNLLQRRMS